MTLASAVTGLGSRVSRAAVVLVVVGFAVQILPSPPTFPWLTALALVLLLGSAWGVTAPVPEPLSTTRALAVSVAAAAGFVLSVSDPASNVDTARWTPFLACYLVAGVVARGRILIGWASVAAACLVVLCGDRFEWFPQPFDSRLLLLPIAGLAGATGWRFILVRIRSEIATFQQQQAQAAAQDAGVRQTLATRHQGLDEVTDLVGPLLKRIADGHDQLDDSAAATLLEAQVRDRIRAVRLAVEPVTTAVRAARSRGVRVILLDDDTTASPLTPGQLKKVEACVDGADRGRLTVRLNPPDRAELGTMVLVTDDTMVRTELT